MPQVKISVSFNDRKHADILAWLAKQENASDAIRRACRAMYQRDASITNADLLVAIEDLKRSGVIVRGETDSTDTAEPSEAEDALEGLGL